MDGNFFWLLLFWVVNNALMYRIGYGRAFADATALLTDLIGDHPLPTDDDRDEDAAYWRKMYEDTVNDLDEVVGPKSFPKEKEDAPGETTKQ